MSCDLILALDVPTREAAAPILRQLRGQLRWVKIGLQMFTAYGPNYVREVAGMGFNIFLDLKLHDIPNTVARATEQVGQIGATFLTVHAFPQTMKAAVSALGASPMKLLAVTVMTSYDDSDLAEAGYRLGVKDLVAQRARQAQSAGVHGLILSAEEVAAMRAALGPDMLLVTPGIRPAGAALADQKRVMTPAEAIRAGSDYLVVGRPVTQAPDPRAAAEAIVAEIAGA